MAIAGWLPHTGGSARLRSAPMPGYELLQTEFSLYSGKARAYLRYKGLEFEQRPATLNAYRKIILPRTGVAMIPVLLTPEGEALQDSSVIIDTLEARHPQRSVLPESPRQRLAALLLELYGDEWLLLPAMHYRWNFPQQNRDFIHGEFGRVLWPNGPAWIRRAVGKRLGARFSGFVPRLGITAETIPAIERWWEETLDVLNAHFQQHRYLLGDRASIGDFGFIGPLYAHLGRDPYPAQLMRERAPGVKIVRFCVDDPQVNTEAVASFARQAALADMGFITTGDADALAKIAVRPGSIAYLPATMVDSACETARVFETPADYLAFMGLVDLALVTKAIKFEEVRLQASNDQVVALGDLVTNFGMKVFYTDGLPGLHRELERRVDSSMP